MTGPAQIASGLALISASILAAAWISKPAAPADVEEPAPAPESTSRAFEIRWTTRETPGGLFRAELYAGTALIARVWEWPGGDTGWNIEIGSVRYTQSAPNNAAAMRAAEAQIEASLEEMIVLEVSP